jgi:hypothetical protein
LGKLNAPELSVVVERWYPLTGLWMLTVAFATTAPEGSVTVPVTFAAFPVCAQPAGAITDIANRNNKDPRDALTNLINESPFNDGGLCAAQRRPRMNCKTNMEFDACRHEHGTR